MHKAPSFDQFVFEKPFCVWELFCSPDKQEIAERLAQLSFCEYWHRQKCMCNFQAQVLMGVAKSFSLFPFTSPSPHSWPETCPTLAQQSLTLQRGWSGINALLLSGLSKIPGCKYPAPWMGNNYRIMSLFMLNSPLMSQLFFLYVL